MHAIAIGSWVSDSRRNAMHAFIHGEVRRGRGSRGGKNAGVFILVPNHVSSFALNLAPYWIPQVVKYTPRSLRINRFL